MDERVNIKSKFIVVIIHIVRFIKPVSFDIVNNVTIVYTNLRRYEYCLT